jgi:surface antigen
VLMGLAIAALLISALAATSYPAHAALSAHAAIGSNTAVPAAPSNLTAKAVGTTSVKLTWTNNAANQSGVVVSRDGVVSVDIQGATVSSYTWSGLSPGTKYAFWIASKIYGTPGDPTGYGNTQSAWVGPAYVTTQGQPAPPAGSLTLGTWPGTTGPAAAAKYYGYLYPDAPVCPPSGGPRCVADQWNFYQGQCTSWVAYRLNQLNGIAFNNSFGGNGTWGNAMNWGPHAQSLGIALNSTPTVGSVAWWTAIPGAHPSGHVAYVEQVNSPTSIVISEMNYDGGNGFRVSTITSSSRDWPTGFIHIHDQ